MKEIYFNKKKVFTQVLIGVVCWIGMIAIPFGLVRIFLFFLGGSFFYFGSKGVSSKPQIILDQETLFIGLKINKTFKWKNVLEARIKTESVDYRKVDFLEVTVLATTQGKRYKRIIDAPVHLLEIDPYELADLINVEIQSYKNSQVIV